MSTATVTKASRKPRIFPVLIIFISLIVVGAILNPFYFQGIAYIVVTILEGIVLLAQGIFGIWTVIQIIRRAIYHAPKPKAKKAVQAAKLIHMFRGGK